MNPFKASLINHRIQQENAKQSDYLQQVPESQWPARRPDRIKEIWRSKEFLVQVFSEKNGVERLSVNRTRLGHDRWQDGITWDELQRLKRECGRGDKCAVEVYPADKNVVNVANMRHLWVLPECPDFVWRREDYVSSPIRRPGVE